MNKFMTDDQFDQLLDDILVDTIFYNKKLKSYTAHILNGTIIIMTQAAIMYKGSDFEDLNYLTDEQSEKLFLILKFTRKRDDKLKLQD